MNTVALRFEDGIAWVAMSRRDKKNAISVEMAREMSEVMDALETDERCDVLVLTGAGESFSAGMDLKDYFRASDGKSAVERARVYRLNAGWQWRGLLHYPKPTIAMVNGWCFGGAFTPLVACDLAIAADEAVFGLSEINWGIPPGGVVSRALAETIGSRDALYYIMTGETFDGRPAAEMGLVHEAVPLTELKAAVTALADNLQEHNPVVLQGAQQGFRDSRLMPWDP